MAKAIDDDLRCLICWFLCEIPSFGQLVLVLVHAFEQNSSVEADNGGFSVDLIHRDLQKSPFYNPSVP